MFAENYYDADPGRPERFLAAFVPAIFLCNYLRGYGRSPYALSGREADSTRGY